MNPASENRKLLLVDDETEIRNGYKMFLNPLKSTPLMSSRTVVASVSTDYIDAFRPFDIAEAASGDQALELVRDALTRGERFAGAIVDVRMPGRLDGLQFIQEAWKLDPDLLVVVATAYNDRSIDEINRLFGGRFQDQWDYLTKPFTSGEIVQKARQLVSSWNRRRQIEAQQRAMTTQEQLAAMGRLARSVGHEFGNILQQLITKLDLIKLRSSQNEPSDLERLADEALEAAVLGAEICQDLLVFGRENHSTATEDQTEPVDMNGAIEKALRLMAHDLKKKGITVEYSKLSHAVARCRESRMVQVMVNLITNSLHALECGGALKITVTLGQQEISIEVKDTGCGIEAAHLPHLFEPLFTTKGESGNGLGLYYCKTIIERYGGRISISSELNKGTAVTLSLPTSHQ